MPWRFFCVGRALVDSAGKGVIEYVIEYKCDAGGRPARTHLDRDMCDGGSAGPVPASEVCV